MNNGTITGLPNVVAVATAPNYGRFAIGPVEEGIAVTLGNALRRILLSSLPGSAITSVRIQNIYHEFSCIPNVREDVTEIVLNVKHIRLRSYSERPVRLQLSKYGTGEVRAADIDIPANIELFSPDLVLANLDGDEAHLDMELTVERGRGYVSFEAREGLPIGTIPVDAIFSPIPKVNYLVQPADAELLSTVVEGEDGTEEAVGKREFTRDEIEGHEQLLLEIWTDGTIDPGEALSLSAQYLAQHSSLISNFNRVLVQATERDLPGAIHIPQHLFEMSIDDLNLSMRTYNCLKRSGVTKVGQVLRMDRKELLGLRNFGEKSLDELVQTLSSRDLIPPGTPLDISATDESISEDGLNDGDDSEGDGDGDEAIGYAEVDDAEGDPNPDIFLESASVQAEGEYSGSSEQVVSGLGMSEGSMAAAAGIYIDDEPASSPIDITDISTADTRDENETVIENTAEEAEPAAKPKSRSKK